MSIVADLREALQDGVAPDLKVAVRGLSDLKDSVAQLRQEMQSGNTLLREAMQSSNALFCEEMRRVNVSFCEESELPKNERQSASTNLKSVPGNASTVCTTPSRSRILPDAVKIFSARTSN